MILGVFGPWQMLAILFLFIIVPGVVLLIVFISRAKHKSRAETLDSVLKSNQTQQDEWYEKLEKLNKLKQSGALTEEEFEAEKKKILK